MVFFMFCQAAGHLTAICRNKRNFEAAGDIRIGIRRGVIQIELERTSIAPITVIAPAYAT
jgi:hypothetical protein